MQNKYMNLQRPAPQTVAPQLAQRAFINANMTSLAAVPSAQAEQKKELTRMQKVKKHLPTALIYGVLAFSHMNGQAVAPSITLQPKGD